MKLTIPDSLRVGGQDVAVSYPNNMEGKLGKCCLSAGYIKIAKTSNEGEQSYSSMLNTFYHELMHLILDTMGRDDLSQDEVFVSSFSSFLIEALYSFRNDNKDEAVQV